MELQFDETELESAKKLINIGLEKAADSMTFFTKDEVSIRSTDVQIKPIVLLNKLINKEDNQQLVILTTEKMGDVGGVCYLIFSEAEVKIIQEKSLPKSILEDPEKLAVMGDAILQEMDNIIVASVVTELANALDTKMFGNVPNISRTLSSEFYEIFDLARKNSNYFLYFKSDIQTKGVDINPDFIWLLDDVFLQRIKDAK